MALTFKVTFDGERLARKLQERAKVAINDISNELVVEAVEYLRLGQHIATGELHDGMAAAKATVDGSTVRGGVTNPAKHARSFAFGVLPGTIVPLADLIRWAEAKIANGFMEPNGRTAEQIARAVQNKIRKYGVPPHRWDRAAIDNTREYAKTRVRRALTTGR